MALRQTVTSGGRAEERRLAILFWFYSEPDICVNRAQLLRTSNPGVPVYGLFGGEPTERARFERALGRRLDDFWAYPEGHDARWKWRHGDLLIADWFVQRGITLPWDSVVVAQWDTLVFEPIERLFANIGRDDLFLPGLRPVSEVDRWWHWVRGDERREYERFLEFVRTRYGYAHEPLCCLFIVPCLPRSFLERYTSIQERERGFLEYRLPVYAQVFGTPFGDPGRLGPWWAADPQTGDAAPQSRVLNAGMEMVSLETILEELRRPDGARLFHPFREVFPLGLVPHSGADACR
jgi:hypothetical protein